MKTLKDCLKQYYFFDENSEPNKFTYEDDTLNAVKEWLEQKRHELDSPDWDSYIAAVRQIFIDELLEELKQ